VGNGAFSGYLLYCVLHTVNTDKWRDRRFLIALT